MRTLLSVCSFVLSVALAVPALASFGGGSPPTPIPSVPPPSGESGSSVRDAAAREYGDAYDNIAKAKKDLADGKDKNADKRFRKALQRGERAVEIDSTYHEAWNLVGYAARQLRDYDRSIAAYQRCLRIKPDYAPAREYLGEAYVELGKLDQAREQLAWLEKAEAEEEMGRLQSAIDIWEKAHPATQAMTPTPKSGTIETAAPPPVVDSLTVPQTQTR